MNPAITSCDFLCVNKCMSQQTENDILGVPQGSILGPLLFGNLCNLTRLWKQHNIFRLFMLMTHRFTLIKKRNKCVIVVLVAKENKLQIHQYLFLQGEMLSSFLITFVKKKRTKTVQTNGVVLCFVYKSIKYIFCRL